MAEYSGGEHRPIYIGRSLDKAPNMCGYSDVKEHPAGPIARPKAGSGGWWGFGSSIRLRLVVVQI